MSLILKPRGRHLSEARRVPTPPPSPPDGSHPDWHAVASPTGMAPAACGPAIVGHGNTANPDAAVDQINALVPQTIVGGLLELAEFVQITTSWITTITFVSWPTTFRTTIRTMSSKQLLLEGSRDHDRILDVAAHLFGHDWTCRTYPPEARMEQASAGNARRSRREHAAHCGDRRICATLQQVVRVTCVQHYRRSRLPGGEERYQSKAHPAQTE
eukprot:6260518-Prymnesium_polylepis.2